MITMNGGSSNGQQRPDGNAMGMVMVVQLQWATAAVGQSMA
jgi:hypothetical protein